MSPAAQITKASVVELSLVVLLCGGIASGAIWATRISLGQEALQKDLKALKDSVLSGASDRWTGRDMHDWVNQANREMEIWSLAAERANGLEPGEWMRFEFPDPDAIH